MLKELELNKIDQGKRARKDYKKVEALWDSIQEHGLISPISVIHKDSVQDWSNYDEDALDEDKPYLLLAGGRRYEAHIVGGAKAIECKIHTDEKEVIQVKRIELYENLDREDLEWAEEVKLKKEIHDLETEVAESEGKKQSIRATARKVNESVGNFSEDLKLAEAIDALPQLQKHKNKSDAKKELRQMMKEYEDKQTIEKIKEERKGQTREDIHKKVASHYITTDIIQGMKTFDSGSVDFVELDPPLKLGFEDNDRYEHSSYNDVDDQSYLPNMEAWLKEAHRVMKENSWILVWYPIEPWHQPVLELMQQVGFKTRGIPLMWNKEQGQTRSANYNLGNAYEVAFYGRKGQPVLEKPGRSNVYTFKKADQSKRFHPTEKPIELYMEILSTFCRKGSVQISGFGGSGNMVLAAQNLNMTCYAFDTSKDWKNKFDLKAYDQVPPNYSSYRV